MPGTVQGSLYPIANLLAKPFLMCKHSSPFTVISITEEKDTIQNTIQRIRGYSTQRKSSIRTQRTAMQC